MKDAVRDLLRSRAKARWRAEVDAEPVESLMSELARL